MNVAVGDIAVIDDDVDIDVNDCNDVSGGAKC